MNTSVEGLAAAIREHLSDSTPWRVRISDSRDAVELIGETTVTGLVAAAVTDDANAGEVVAHAWRLACEHDSRLRAVHVWTGRGAEAGGVHARPDRAPSADLLLSEVLYDVLPQDQADATEREILHDRDPARALRALSRELDLLVVAAASDQLTPDRPFGATVGALIGHTACPLTVVMPERARRRE